MKRMLLITVLSLAAGLTCAAQISVEQCVALARDNIR